MQATDGTPLHSTPHSQSVLPLLRPTLDTSESPRPSSGQLTPSRASGVVDRYVLCVCLLFVFLCVLVLLAFLLLMYQCRVVRPAVCLQRVCRRGRPRCKCTL